jgi:type VI secretion system protein ImpB
MGSNDSSVAPKERVNIVYKSQVGDSQAEVELPLKVLVTGDFTGREDQTPLEERKPINIDKGTFNEVMAKQGLALTFNVPDKLSGAKDAELPMQLKFETLADFGPEGLANQVPQLKQLLELRTALSALKHPLASVPAFRKRIQTLLADPDARQKLTAELGINGESEKK